MIRTLMISSALLVGMSACAPNQADGPNEPVQNQAPYFGVTFEQTLNEARVIIDEHIDQPLIIPVPKDAGGGYTHEAHKENAKLIYDAGQLYTLTGEEKYATFASKLMSAYADVYPDWGFHPAQKEQSPGRMFWQNLNESWWLVHVAQSYGAIKNTLSDEQKSHIETRLLRNMADFLSKGSPETFDKIHNHGTWATAAVGMTGYAIGDRDYSEQALMGLDKSGEAGFLKQLDELFSPDGYYNEGPYYQRYALMPFILFGQAVEANEPEREIFKYRDGILKKAVYTTIHLNYNGLFFPINDAIKDKGIATTELLYGVSILYDLTADKELLSVAEAQGKFVLTPEARAVSDALVAGEAESFSYQSMRLSDGAEGADGALDILRASSDPQGLAVIAKNTSQGLGHGHFDKLGLLVFDAGHEILRDYGAARFLNVEAKYGGHYLRENNSYAKQTVAHNALVVDQTSHFGGITSVGNQHAPTVKAFIDTPTLKATTASIDTAYESVVLTRTVAVIDDPAFPESIIIDLIKGASDTPHIYDLPFHYNGHLVETNFEVMANPVSRSPLGADHGYEHLWRVADEQPEIDMSQITWILEKKFYSVSSTLADNARVIFTEVGATDPDFNLRREPGFILRTEGANNVAYASIIEPHGEYNPTVEYTKNSHSHVKSITHFEEGEGDYVRVETHDGDVIGLAIAMNDNPAAEHSLTISGETVSWKGPYKLFSSQHTK